MTTSEIKYIINETLGEAIDVITPLNSVAYIKISSHELKVSNVKSMRFKFNTKTEMLECYPCKEYNGEIPSSWKEGIHYDTFNNKIYKYMIDSKTLDVYKDIYDFSAITLIAPHLGGKS